jgi:oxygen-independent coproporphyrinogen-3 oxidase
VFSHRRDPATVTAVYFGVPSIHLPRHFYLHVPFCARRCAYCDFAIAVRRTVPVDAFVRSVRSELDLRFPDAREWELDTLYFGGGTPSKLGARGVSALMDELRRSVSLVPGAEVTLEANPEDVTIDVARAWRDAGITRLSLGAQSFDDAVLTWMHRTHDAAGISRAVDAARSAGFNDYSLDLIFALPSAVTRDWENDVLCASALEPTHVSLYGLTVEPRTPLGHQQARGELTDPPEESYEREFLYAHDALASAGFEHYEVSNFARPGKRARHNSAYWTGAPYVGIGPSAHEFDGSVRRWNVEPYAEWTRLLDERRDPLSGDERLTADNRAAERVYLGLRTTDGLVLDSGEAERVEPWIAAGWAKREGNRVVLTPLGWLRLDALAAALTVVRSH